MYSIVCVCVCVMQGGMFVFQGKQLLFSHRDAATGAHTDLKNLLSLATEGLSRECDTECAIPPSKTNT